MPAPNRHRLRESLAFALTSRRTLAVALLSFSSGLPLGLMIYSLPLWMTQAGFDIRTVGLITLAQAPWTFKVLWAPLLDRYRPGFLGHRRGWIVLFQVALCGVTLLLAGVGAHPEAPWVFLALALALAFAAASQDIVIDAYAVEVLQPEEQGVAVGTRIALYRAAMFVAGGVTITATAWLSWRAACALLALLYLPLAVVAVRAPEPEGRIEHPRTLREAVWLPFLGFLSRHRALEILAFVLTYKLADNLADTLLTPFLGQMGYGAIDIGVAKGTVMLAATLIGTFLGGALTPVLGLGHCLWLFGFLQIFSNVGYVLVAESGINRPLLYGAMAFESACKGMGMGAFGVLLLRLTQRRFSATQYALFSSLFALPRLVAGPVAGFTVHAVGWTAFYWMTLLAGLPGLVLLARFVPPGVREPVFSVEPVPGGAAPGRAALAARGLFGGAAGMLAALVMMALLAALQSTVGGRGFQPLAELFALLRPADAGDLLRLLGAAIVGGACGLLAAAVAVARSAGGGAWRPGGGIE